MKQDPTLVCGRDEVRPQLRYDMPRTILPTVFSGAANLRSRCKSLCESAVLCGAAFFLMMKQGKVVAPGIQRGWEKGPSSGSPPGFSTQGRQPATEKFRM